MDTEPRRLAKKLSLYKKLAESEISEKTITEIEKLILSSVKKAYKTYIEKAKELRVSEYGHQLVNFSKTYYGVEPEHFKPRVMPQPNRAARRQAAKRKNN